MRTVTQEEFLRSVRGLTTRRTNWNTARSRWKYHACAIAHLLQRPTMPDKILELGAFGGQIVPGSHTMDFKDNWNFRENSPNYWHDVRDIPWPIPDTAYDWFVAMRVFHHLHPMQKQAFFEALRIARSVLIVVPERVSKDKQAKGIPRERFREWRAPDHEEDVGTWGRLYVWRQ